MITRLKLSLSNAYLIHGNKPMLVDSGTSRDAATIRTHLAKHGFTVADLSFVLHTHVHSDHVGGTATLLKQAATPTAYHRHDHALMQQGHNGRLRGVGSRGKVMASIFSNTRFVRFTPSLYVEDGMRLDPYGVAGCILHTPGHTAGSISILLDSGEAIIGDVLMGGYMGGTFLPHFPQYHYFADDLQRVQQSVRRILDHAPHILYVGHGGPLSAERIRKRWQGAAWLMLHDQVERERR